jgi:4-amino-4-deoxy-L-arabinose transferase-like glycosyltransferase
MSLPTRLPRLAVLGVAGLTWLGLTVLVERAGILAYAAAVRNLRANQVWFGGMPSIGSLGFDLPPLPTVLQLPLVLVPALRSNALAGAIVASLAALLLGWSLLGALRRLGVGGGAAAVLTLAVLLNPLLVYAVATGAGDVLATALLVLGVRLVLDWAHDERHSLALFGGAFALGVASLARYDLVLAAAALTGLVAVLSGRRPGQQAAYAIAFGTPAAAMLGLWLVVNWLATGNPLTFVAHAARVVPAGYAASVGNGNRLAHFVLIVPVMILGVPGAGALLARGGRQARAVLVLGVVALAVVGWIAADALAGGSPGLLTALPLVPLSVLLLATLARALSGRAAWPLLVGVSGLVSVVVPFAALAARAEPGEGYAAVVELLTGRSVTPMWSSEQALGTALREQSGGRDVLLDDERDALPAFFVGAPGRLIATADADFAAVLSDPRGRAPQVLVQTPGGGDDDQINAAWPRLYAAGVGWAQQVGEWPVTDDPTSRYRLFEVRAS